MNLPTFAATWLALLCLAPGVARAQTISTAEPPRPEPKVLGVDVTFLANAGFFLESGKYSVLIDAFLKEPVELYSALPEEVYRDLVNARAPFDGLALVLVSHDHADHVQIRGLEKFLANNRQAQLVSSPEFLGTFRGQARDSAALQRQVTPIRTTPGAMTVAAQEEVSVEFFELKHGGKANVDVKNLAHLIEIGGVRVLHVGDAEATPENFQRYDLKSRKIDVVLVPYLFFGKPAGVQVLREEIQARTVIACHVPRSEWDKLNELMKANFPDVILVKDALEKRSFLPAETAPGAPVAKPGG